MINGVINESMGAYGCCHTVVLYMLSINPRATIAEMSKEADVSVRTIQRAMADLKKDGIIKRLGSNKTGYWEIIR